MRKAILTGLLFVFVQVLPAALCPDGAFLPTYEERQYQGSLEQHAQEGIIIFKDGLEDLILKVTYQGKPKDFAWVVPFPSIPEIFSESAELFHELFAYVEHALAERSKKGVWFGCGKKAEEEREEAAGVEVIARKTVGNYETTTVKETVKGALNQWLKQNGYVELKGAEEELEYYRKLGWVFAAIKVREAISGEERVDLHPLRFRFRTPQEDEMVYPMRLSVFQKSPLDVNLYILFDSMINIDYDEKGVLTKGFDARYEEGSSVLWSRNRVENGPQMYETRRFFLKNYPRDSFCLTNIQARALRPADIRQWGEDLYIYPQYVYPFDPSTWYWPQWLGLFAAIAAILVTVKILIRFRRRRKAASA